MIKKQLHYSNAKVKINKYIRRLILITLKHTLKVRIVLPLFKIYVQNDNTKTILTLKMKLSLKKKNLVIKLFRIDYVLKNLKHIYKKMAKMKHIYKMARMSGIYTQKCHE